MDLHVPPRPSIWQKHCSKNSHEKTRCLFSRSSNFYRKSDAPNPGFHNRNCVGKPPSLLRLSSTGDSVEDTAEFRSFDPSNLRGSESNSRDRGKTKLGFFDRVKFAFSAKRIDYRPQSSMSFTRESSESLTGQLDLSILVEKFDRPHKMETTGQYAYDNGPPIGVRSHQGGLNGFVKEGIYHPFTRNSPHEAGTARPAHPATETLQRPVIQAFPFVNIGPFYPPNHRHQHPHPYMRRNHFMPAWRSAGNMSSSHFQHHTPPGASPVASDATHMSHSQGPAWPGSAQIRDSASLRNWPVDPRIRAQFISAESIAARVQGHVNEPKEIVQSHNGSRPCRHDGRNHMMKNQTGMTHMTRPNQNPNKFPGCAHPGNPHQAHWQCAKNTMPKQNNGFLQKSAKNHQPVSVCRIKPTKQDGKAPLNQRHQENHKVQEFEKKVEAQDSVTEEVKGLQIRDVHVPKTTDFKTEIETKVHCACTPSMHQHPRVTSSDGPLWETVPCETAEPESESSTGPKSGDNESTTNIRPTSNDDKKCHLPDSQIGLDSVNVESAQSVYCTKESFPLIVDEAGPSETTQSQDPESAESRLSSSGAAVVTSPQGQPQANSLSPSIQEQSPNSKPLHSSLAFLLSETANSDSDFTDSDWDSTGTSPSSDSWDFLKCCDDPYNPLYGWKCASRFKQDDNKQGTESKLDSGGDDELDSGISSLQTQQDDTVDVSPDESDSWDEDGCDNEESSNSSQLWKSFCSSSDCFNPLNGWMCNTAAKSSQAPDNDSCTTTENTNSPKRPFNSEVQFKRQEQDEPKESSSLPVTKKLSSRPCETLKSEGILTPQNIVTEPKKLHPSVLFILGVDDSDSESDREDPADFDDCTPDSSDSTWNSFQFQVCSDPYNPLQGWKLHVATPEKLCPINASYGRLASLDENSRTELSDSTKTVSQSGATAPKTVVKPLLKRASSTGCLWVPANGSGPDRPFLNKKVHFCEDSPTVISFEVPSWSSEYSDSRRGPWQEMARDRCRFHDRIRSTEAQIARVFTPDHRRKMQQRLLTAG